MRAFGGEAISVKGGAPIRVIPRIQVLELELLFIPRPDRMVGLMVSQGIVSAIQLIRRQRQTRVTTESYKKITAGRAASRSKSIDTRIRITWRVAHDR